MRYVRKRRGSNPLLQKPLRISQTVSGNVFRTARICRCMYCSNCGAEVADEARFCPSCGSAMGKVERPYGDLLKDPSITALYSFLIVGSGQVTLGDMRRGLTFLISAILTTFVLIVLGITYDGDVAHMIAVLFFAALLFGIWIVNILDAYNQARLYNCHLVDVKDLDK